MPEETAERRAAAFFGCLAAFVVAVALVRFWRPAVLFGPDRSWWRLWLLIAVGTFLGVVCAGVAAAKSFRLFASSPLSRAGLRDVPIGRGALLATAVAALVTGTLLRAAWLADPPPLFSDEVTLVTPALALHGTPSDFVPPWRAAPFGVPKPYGSIGVVYLEFFRATLRTFGTTAAGLRVASVSGGIASLFTAALLARALLPVGGGTFAAVALAGLRWQLIMSSWGWVAVWAAPLLDVAALLLVRARSAADRRRRTSAAASGLMVGLAAQVYLVGWVGFAALLFFALWPDEEDRPLRRRLGIAALYALGFAAAVLPLAVLRGPHDPPYFARVGSHNLLREFRLQKSAMPLFKAAEDAILAPWFVPEPQGWADLPDRSRLGLVIGAAVAIALGRALARPREAVSAYLLPQAGFALATAVLQGTSGNPNGYRFAYLASATAVAAAAGAVATVSASPERWRRRVSLAGLGLFAISGTLAARDALLAWPVSRFRFEGFRAEETLIARAAERWRPYGEVNVEVMPHATMPRALEKLHLFRGPLPAAPGTARFRIVSPGAPRAAGERLVEVVADAWGREWAVVLARRGVPGLSAVP